LFHAALMVVSAIIGWEKSNPSYSGSAQEESMIIYNESVGASGNRMVGYLYASGISLEFYIASDMDVDDRTRFCSTPP